MTDPITFACVQVGNYRGRGAEYVNILYDMVRRNLPNTVLGRFVCFTDNPSGLDPGVSVKLLPRDLTGWWAKLYMFAPGVFADGERVVYFDLDTVITGALDDIIARDEEFLILEDFYRPGGYGSGMMSWRAGFGANIWSEWLEAGQPDLERGDQEWIQKQATATFWQDVLPGQIMGYKAHCLAGLPFGTRVVCFHGEPKNEDCLSVQWVRDIWKIGGLAGSAVELVCNARHEDIASNVASALKRGLHELPRREATDQPLCIVGGGPSAADHIEGIRARYHGGQTIWALNGAGNWLAWTHAINPHGIWICDARPQNAAFLSPRAPFTHVYLASMCHPDVFDAVPNPRRITLWHDAGCHGWLPDGVLMIGGGTTVLTKAMVGAWLLGYRRISLFGVDSSFRDAQHHAYAQPWNDRDGSIGVTVEGQQFRAAPWMVQQVNDFQSLSLELANEGCEFRVFGDGLLPFVARAMQRNQEKAA